jgi:hypothetical protein
MGRELSAIKGVMLTFNRSGIPQEIDTDYEQCGFRMFLKVTLHLSRCSTTPWCQNGGGQRANSARGAKLTCKGAPCVAAVEIMSLMA